MKFGRETFIIMRRWRNKRQDTKAIGSFFESILQHIKRLEEESFFLLYDMYPCSICKYN